jgi:hypothetical protein
VPENRNVVFDDERVTIDEISPAATIRITRPNFLVIYTAAFVCAGIGVKIAPENSNDPIDVNTIMTTSLNSLFRVLHTA